MRVQVERESLVEALEMLLEVVVEDAKSLPDRCVHLAVDFDQLVLSGRDETTKIQVSTTALQVEAITPCAVSAKALLHAARSLAGRLQLEPCRNLGLQVSKVGAPERHFQIWGFQPQEVTAAALLEPEPAECMAVLPVRDMLRMLNQTAYAMAKEGTRYAMNGLRIERDLVTPGTLRLASTDGHRLAMAWHEQPVGEALKLGQGIMPTLFVDTLQKILFTVDDSAIVTLRLTDKTVTACVESHFQMILQAELLEGQFPPIQDVIPKDPLYKAELQESMDAVADIATSLRVLADLDDTVQAVRITFEPGGLRLGFISVDTGTASFAIAATGELPTSDPMTIGICPRYLEEALAAGQSHERLTVCVKGPNRPLLVRGDRYLSVTMPVNLS